MFNVHLVVTGYRYSIGNKNDRDIVYYFSKEADV